MKVLINVTSFTDGRVLYYWADTDEDCTGCVEVEERRGEVT